MDYPALLKKAQQAMPEQTTPGARFEVPKVAGHVEGNKTIITNFKAMCSSIRREPEHVLKYLQRELATPGIIQDTRLILNRKLSSASINEKLERYVKEFVLCSECRKPDTQLIREDRITTLKCMACGAKHPVKAKI